MQKKILIIGGGPAGSTLGAFLAMKGIKVALIDPLKRSDLFVGESFIPAMIPILRDLGVEELVGQEGRRKPGASIWIDKNTLASVAFAEGEGQLPSYAFNIERNKFDKILLENAEKKGLKVFQGNVSLEKGKKGELCIDEESEKLIAAYFEGKPDFIIDCSGRRRLIANRLGLPVKEGKRKDVALFAHVEKVRWEEEPDNIHMHRCKEGWCWRIPLKGKTSVGFVANKKYMESMGANAAEQFDAFMQKDEQLKGFFQNAKRITKVQRFSNYQMETEQLFGDNWALLGDAAGFLDPVFSSGLYLAMNYAKKLGNALDTKQNYTLSDYEREWKEELISWKKMIAIWYNGRLFMNYQVGQERKEGFLGKRMEPHLRQHFTRIFTGEAVLEPYSMRLLGFMTGNLLDVMSFLRMHNYNLEDLKIK